MNLAQTIDDERDFDRMPELADTLEAVGCKVAEILRPYLGIGVRHFVVGFPHPYDTETMERLIRDVVPLLRA